MIKLFSKDEVDEVPTRKFNAGWIDDMVGAMSDPIIVWPSPWQADIPEWIFGEIKMQRHILLMTALVDESLRGLATDAEALAYMYPLCMEQPLDRDWADIYLYLGTRVMKNNMSNRKERLPSDIARDSLTKDQTRDLDRLKRWIYERRVKARKAKARGERLEAKEEAKTPAAKPEDLMEPMFPF